MGHRRGSLYRMYLVLAPLRDVLSDLGTALRPLDEIDPYLPGAEGFYDAKSDAALVGLHFQRRAVEHIGARAIMNVVGECGLPVIAPEELPARECEAFFAQHLPTYEVHFQQYPGGGAPLVSRIVDALAEHAVAAGLVPAAGSTPRANLRRRVRFDSVEATVPRLAPLPRERASSRWEMALDLDRGTDLGIDLGARFGEAHASDDDLVEIELWGDPTEPRKRPSSDWELVI